METPPVVRLANDIAEQFTHKPHDAAVAAVARHITMFWDPRMRTQLTAVLEIDHADLSPLAREAAQLLAAEHA